MATDKQLAYAEILLERHEQAGSLEDVIHEMHAEWDESEDIMDWFKRLHTGDMSRMIQIMKEGLED